MCSEYFKLFCMIRILLKRLNCLLINRTKKHDKNMGGRQVIFRSVGFEWTILLSLLFKVRVNLSENEAMTKAPLRRRMFPEWLVDEKLVIKIGRSKERDNEKGTAAYFQVQNSKTLSLLKLFFLPLLMQGKLIFSHYFCLTVAGSTWWGSFSSCHGPLWDYVIMFPFFLFS